MWFGYNPQIIFYHFFCYFNLGIFSGVFTVKVNGYWVPCVRNSSYSFMPILLKLYRCFCHDLKIIMAGDINSLNLLVGYCEGGTS